MSVAIGSGVLSGICARTTGATFAWPVCQLGAGSTGTVGSGAGLATGAHVPGRGVAGSDDCCHFSSSRGGSAVTEVGSGAGAALIDRGSTAGLAGSTEGTGLTDGTADTGG